jgi:hypothetical protein
MARKLKTYQTSLGFFDLAVAAPSMKAALQAWGAARNLFHDRVAKQSDDPGVIAAAMARPGVVLKRPVGSSEPFKELASLPTNLADRKAGPKTPSAGKTPPRQTQDRAADRKAELAFEKEQHRRERERAKQEAEQEKERVRRQRTRDKAQRNLDSARRKHEAKASRIQAEREALEKKSQVENARWEKERGRLEEAVRRVSG